MGPIIEMYVSAAYSVLSFLAGYVFLGIGLSRLAKALGCPRPWLAWIPFGCLYLLGQVADIYTDNRMTTEADRDAPFYGPSKLRRKLLGYSIGSTVSGGMAAVGAGFFAMAAILSIFTLMGAVGGALSDTPPLMMTLYTIGGLVAFVAGIIYMVMTIMYLTAYCPALCRIYSALGVPSQTLLTAVSVFFPSLGGILIFAYTRRSEGLAEKFAPPDSAEPVLHDSRAEA